LRGGAKLPVMKSTTSGGLWNLDFIFPNLIPTKPLEIGPFCICAGTDSRLGSLAPGALNATATQLLKKFAKVFGDAYIPGVLLTRDGAPRRYMRGEAVRDFRNSYALATIESAVALAMIATGSVWEPRFADHFLFGYYIPLKDGYVGTLDGIVQGVNDEVAKFRGQPSPQIALPEAFKPSVDPILLSRLMAAWRLRYGNRRGNYQLRKLFRSLVVAFQASLFPSDGLTSISDVGLRIATWVSAFEVLFHPGARSKVNKKLVLDEIGTIDWPSPELNRRRYRLRCEGRPYRANFPQAIYDELYAARNKFLHGEKVTRIDQHLKRSPRRIPLTMLAPLLFGAAVRVLLDRILGKPLTGEERTEDFFLGLGKVDEALVEARTGKRVGPRRRARPTSP